MWTTPDNPQAQAEYELGRLISAISNVTYREALGIPEAIRLYETIKPTLTPMQDDAWTIVIDLMYEEARENVA